MCRYGLTRRASFRSENSTRLHMTDATVTSMREELLETTNLLVLLGPGQVQGLAQFVEPRACVTLDLDAIRNVLEQDFGPEELFKLQQAALYPNAPITQETNDKPRFSSMLAQLVQVYRLHLFRKLLQTATQEQLLLIFRILDPTKQQVQRLDLLNHIQQLLSDLEQDTLLSLHEKMAAVAGESSESSTSTTTTTSTSNSTGTLEIKHQEAEELHKLVALPTEWFHLYEPLRQLLQLPVDEVLNFKSFFPFLGPIEKTLLLSLVDAGLYFMSDMIRMLVPEKEPTSIEYVFKFLEFNLFFSFDEDTTWKLTVLDQPPEKCVYRRNVKPAPTIFISGDQTDNDGNLYIVPSLVRCDTGEELVDMITGAEPQRCFSKKKR